MLVRVYSCAVIGLQGVIVGPPDAAVQESREMVQTAVKNAGLNFPCHRIVVNLAPATVRKEGPDQEEVDTSSMRSARILRALLKHDPENSQAKVLLERYKL